jgi:hypothetical protein
VILWRHLVAVAAVGLPFAMANAAEAPWPPHGIYSDVRLSELSGDLRGLEIRFYAQGDKQMAEVVLCEGWCSQTYHTELTRTEHGFAFSYVETYSGGEGELRTTFRFLVQPHGSRLRVAMWIDSDRFDGDGWRVLRRKSKPFGIAVANSGRD